MNNESNFDNTIKLLLIGDSSVGKTNFIFRFVDNRFQTVHLTTIGFDFKSKIVTLPNSKKNAKITNLGHSRSRKIYVFKSKFIFESSWSDFNV